MAKREIFVKRLDSISEWAGRIFSWILAPLMGLVVFEVIVRRLFNAPTIWTFETSKFLFGALFMLVASYALLHKSHVMIDILRMRWSPRTQTIVDVVAYVIFFFPFVGVILWWGTRYAITSWSTLEASWSIFHPPLYPIKTVIPVAAALLIIQGISDFVKRLVFVIKGVKL